MNKEIPTTLELLDLALSRDEAYLKSKSILEIDMPCMDVNMNRFFRAICRNWEFDIEQPANLPPNKMVVRHKGKPARKELMQFFARVVLSDDNAVMFRTLDPNDSSIHFNYMRGTLREVHIELNLDGYMIIHTKIA